MNIFKRLWLKYKLKKAAKVMEARGEYYMCILLAKIIKVDIHKLPGFNFNSFAAFIRKFYPELIEYLNFRIPISDNGFGTTWLLDMYEDHRIFLAKETHVRQAKADYLRYLAKNL